MSYGRTNLTRVVAVMFATLIAGGCVSAGSSPVPVTATLRLGPSAHSFQEPVGFAAGVGWSTPADGLAVSPDGGHTWRPAPLPNGVSANRIAAVTTVPGRATWLAAEDAAQGISLFTATGADPATIVAADWIGHKLEPVSVDGLDISGLQPDVKITPGPGRLLTVTATYMWSRSTGATWLFTSMDDGVTFVEHPAPARGGIYGAWNSLAFRDDKNGLVVAGMASANLFRTNDAGASWSELPMKMLAAPIARSFGTLMTSGSAILVPVTLFDDAAGTSFEVLVTEDSGATFSAGKRVQIGNSSSVATDTAMGTTWAITNAGDFAFISADKGGTWTSVQTGGLPSGVVALAVTGPNAATAEVQEGGCANFKANCWQRWVLYSTADGGRTWNQT